MPIDDPLWYKDAVIYELHVRTFQDSNRDGIGDFQGLTQRLDYLQDLGVTAIWLLPFYPSPLKDDGYDIADYTDVHADYGTLQDFEEFLTEAHRRGLHVITELVLNHTSDQHPWFQRARRARPGSPERDFYVWTERSESGEIPERYGEARIIFKDFETSNWTWDPVAMAYYWHRFYAHQPDLNFDNPQVRQAMFDVVDFWLNMGVDGLRLDAVPYLYERDGTNCENLPETYAFLKELRRHVDEKFPNRMLLAEANQWPEDAAAYFGQGDMCHMAFHFPLMPRIFMAVHMEDRFPIIDILEQTPSIPETSQWAMFLRNHDELTLEMVTDEERDYMYRVYARDPEARINLGIRRRLAPLMGNNRRRIELMNGLLMALPGSPILYYGDEIGMGDNFYLGDRNGVRTPMQWSADRNAGFSRANPQRLCLPIIIDPEYHYEASNVEAQQNNSSSLLWWMKRLIAHRKRFQAFGRGSLEFLQPENPKVLAFLRRHDDELILMVANLSRFVQHAELDLSEFRGLVPIELFGRVEFPPIGKPPYFLTLAPHTFYWFSLEPSRAGTVVRPGQEPHVHVSQIRVTGSWENVFAGTTRKGLERALQDYLMRRGFGWPSMRNLKAVEVEETVPVAYNGQRTIMTMIRAEPFEFEGETTLMLVPLAFAEREQADAILERLPQSGVAFVYGDAEGLIYDALGEPNFSQVLLDLIAKAQPIQGASGRILAWNTPAFETIRGPRDEVLETSLLEAEQSNTSVVYGNRLILKLYRRLDEGVNPDLEVSRFLTERGGLPYVPTLAGALEYRQGRAEPRTLAILHEYVPNEGDAWSYTLDALSRFFERAVVSPEECEQALPRQSWLELAEQEVPELAIETIGSFLESARVVGRRTAEMHQALASDRTHPAFAPEAYSTMDQRSLYQSMRTTAGRALRRLRQQLPLLPGEAAQDEARALLERHAEILAVFRPILDHKLTARKIRSHGHYHLGQLLYTGKDFVIIDFEGEPGRFLSERRRKRLALYDVATMIMSAHYAAYSSLSGQVAGRESLGGLVRPEDREQLEPWTRFWHAWVAACFLKEYLDQARDAVFLPRTSEELSALFHAVLLQEAMGNLSHELDTRPDWAWIPLRGVMQVLEALPATHVGTGT